MKTLVFILALFTSLISSGQLSDFATINFDIADARASRLQGHDLKNLPDLSRQLTQDFQTDVEQFRAIFMWVIQNISNDYALYHKNSSKREYYKTDSLKLANWNSSFRKKLFKKLLKQKRTICTGYAYLVKELANLADIECKVVQGYGRVSTTHIENLNLPNHSWNAVKLNGKWYLCDPTWASGVPDAKNKDFEFKYNDGFFLPDPRLFAVNHYPLNSQWWLLNENIPDFESFLHSPVIYGNAYRNLKLLNSPLEMHQTIEKKQSVTFNMELKDELENKKINLVIDSGHNQWNTSPSGIRFNDNDIEIEHQFKSRGFYDVHLYIDRDLIATYTVEVN